MAECFGRGWDQQWEKRILGHAELLALEQADKHQFSTEKRDRARLFTNLEPGPTCVGAAKAFFLGEIVYGPEPPGRAAVESAGGWIRKESNSRQRGVATEAHLSVFS